MKVIATQSGGIGLTEVANQVDLPKSTVSRMLATLEEIDAVERLPGSDGFRIGQAVVSLALHVPYTQHLITIARPHLLKLAELTGEAVSLCLPDGDRAHYVDQVQSRHHIQVRDWTGSRLAMHVVSPGKVFLAYWSAVALTGYLARPLEKYTAHTLTDPAALRQRLVQIREQGYDLTFEEFAEGLNAAAAPIFDKSGQVIAAINIYGPAFRFPPDGGQAEVIRWLLDASDKIGAVRTHDCR